MIRTFFYQKELVQQNYSIELIVAFSFWRRLIGFMGKKQSIPGMIFNRTNQIHMFFMQFPLDIYFLDRNGLIIDIQKNVAPWRISRLVRNAYYVIEIPVGYRFNENEEICIGDQFIGL